MALVALAFNCSKAQQVPAFPGAEGAGKFTSGGRGGFVYTVTNLNDDGPGSLRDGVQKKGARTIVFGISGIIDLKSQLAINNGDLTIAGQSAPGDGICISGQGLRINADNVILRYLRIRPGDGLQTELDALTGMRQADIIVDHCSLSWATDEVCSLYDINNLTLQWCILSESLNNSFHSKGSHGYGGIWGGQKATFHHNLLAHHTSRNPRLQGSRGHKRPKSEQVEMVNNVVYNWRSKCIYAGEEGNYSIIANFFKPGPATGKKASRNILEPYKPFSNYNFSENIVDGNKELSEDNRKAILMPIDSITRFVKSEPLYNSGIKIETAQEAYLKVLNTAGANLIRDKVDKRIVEEVKNGSALGAQFGIINSQEDVGGWPEIKSVIGPVDSDKDGMPDNWEVSQGLNAHDNTDGSKYILDKYYTNLEMYLNSLLKQIL
ncbi:pectate lyase [Marinilabiliaceae bacterium N1Y90]|nr:pectate lyase [Marinilabiliaceae bacterium N1Y90]